MGGDESGAGGVESRSTDLFEPCGGDQADGAVVVLSGLDLDLGPAVGGGVRLERGEEGKDILVVDALEEEEELVLLDGDLVV
jgi:hypothetical protein